MNITTASSTVTSPVGASVLDTSDIATSGAGRMHRVLSAAGRLAMKGVIAAAPAINLSWCVGLPPYDYPLRVIR